MNGLVKVTAEGKEYTLRFSMHGCHEFERRLYTNPSDDKVKALTDMIYGGLYGEAMRNEQPAPPYSDAADLLEAIANEDNYVEQSLSIQKVYEESKFGKEAIERWKEKGEQDGKKKIEKEKIQ